MSTGAECNFREREPGKWFYDIQQWPYGDWPEYTREGPFETLEAAEKHLQSNYANPGGYSVEHYGKGKS